MAEGGARPDEHEGLSRQERVSSQQALWENASVETCSVMAWLGYGPVIRQARSDAYREMGRSYTAQARGEATWIVTGSKAEGLTCIFESDTDILGSLHSVICLEERVNASTFPKEITVLRSYSRVSYPGHCRLLLERRGKTMLSKVNDAFCDDGYGRELLSSDLYVHTWGKIKLMEDIVQHDRAGPSIPSTNRGVLHRDIVMALRYHCPNIMSKWAARHRHWPSPEVVQEVVSLGSFLTPVGFKGSEYKHVEWRVCFNAGEIVLVNNLNDTQVQLYGLLKMVKTDVLNPCMKEVTSYTMKNIVFWIAENTPQSLFHERSLLHWLHEGLDALRVALVSGELPYYMIPERNLMAASGLGEEQRRTWVSTISDMMNEGPRVILRLSKIRQAIIAHPEPFRWYNMRRMKLEMLVLIYNTYSDHLIMDEIEKAEQTDVMRVILRHIGETVMAVQLRMIMEGSGVDSLFNIFNRMLM